MRDWVVLGRDVMRQARHARGLSYEAVGRALHVSSKTYERWEQAGRVPRGDISRVAEVIGLHVEQAVFTEAEALTVTLPAEDDVEELRREIRQLRTELRTGLEEVKRLLDPAEDSPA